MVHGSIKCLLTTELRVVENEYRLCRPCNFGSTRGHEFCSDNGRGKVGLISSDQQRLQFRRSRRAITIEQERNVASGVSLIRR